MTQPPKWTYVCHRDDIVPNTGVCAKVGNTQVAVFRVVSPTGEEEGIFAIDNLDPRSGASVIARGLVGDLSGQIVVASPVYKNHFCLKTGRCLEDESWSVQPYAVQVSDDDGILVQEL
ncbi:MAG: nitrite reductase small subunit NirD [Panacagrimonas sp.]